MTRIVSICCLVLLTGCQQPLVSPPADLPESARTDVANNLLGPDQLAELKAGTKCTVTLADSTRENARQVSGTVASAADGVLVLSDAEEIITGRSERGVPAIGNVPYVNRLFKNVGVGVIRNPLGTETLSAKQIKSVRIED